MGTRSDFYVGRGKDAEWVCSKAYDGYPGGIDKPILEATTETDYRSAIAKMVANSDDCTVPTDGWPWPWNNSHTTDYAYAFDNGKIWASCFGHEWFNPLLPHADGFDDNDKNMDSEKVEFPDMTDKQNVTFGRRSGLLIFTSP